MFAGAAPLEYVAGRFRITDFAVRNDNKARPTQVPCHKLWELMDLQSNWCRKWEVCHDPKGNWYYSKRRRNCLAAIVAYERDD
jgi:hypothetical protein